MLAASGYAMTMKRDIAEIIEAVVRERLAGVAIDRVQINEETDYDGDAVFRILVVFDNNKAPLDSHKTSGIVRHIRHKLLERQETAFPIFAFVSKSDAAGIKTEAA
jgi:hypothetical protein